MIELRSVLLCDDRPAQPLLQIFASISCYRTARLRDAFICFNVRGMVILPSLGKDFFTSDSKEFFA